MILHKPEAQAKETHSETNSPSLALQACVRSQCVALFAVLAAGVIASAADPCQSGPQPGQRTGEYTSIISTGAERGKTHCYICDAGEQPSAIIFARSLSDPLAKLVQGLDKAREDYKDAKLHPWVTFLNTDQTSFDPEVVAWAKKHGIRNVPLGIFEDMDGPPSYALSREADVTVLLNLQQHVVVNLSFRKGELTEERIAEVIKEIDKFAGGKK